MNVFSIETGRRFQSEITRIGKQWRIFRELFCHRNVLSSNRLVSEVVCQRNAHETANQAVDIQNLIISKHCV